MLVFAPFLKAQTAAVADCRGCELRATLLVQLGVEDGPGALGDPASAIRRQNGQWVVTDFLEPSYLKVFSAEGRFLRAVGREGQGPGEYGMALWASTTPGDSLRVADLKELRITTLSPGLASVRTQKLGGAFRSIEFLDDGRVVVAATVASRSGIGLPLHLVSGAGDVVLSFGAESPIENLRNTDALWRSLAIAPQGDLWSARLTSYTLERWSLETGQRLQVLERDAEWFPPQEEYGLQTDPDQEPIPGLLHISVDPDGNLWTMSHVGDEDYGAAIVDGQDPYGRPAKRVYDFAGYYDTVIEVISPSAHQVLGKARLDGHGLSFAGEMLVATGDLVPPGYPVVNIWKLELPPLHHNPGGIP